jgi:hypothetical protein
MWPWKLEIALLFGIQVSPSESIRKVMSPPSCGLSALRAGLSLRRYATKAGDCQRRGG